MAIATRTRAVLVGAVVALAATGAAAGGTSADRTTALRLVDRDPLVLRGAGFAARERVVVRVTIAGITRPLSVRASSTGAFVARFPKGIGDRCSGLVARALGAQGSRALLKVPQAACPPPLE